MLDGVASVMPGLTPGHVGPGLAGVIALPVGSYAAMRISRPNRSVNVRVTFWLAAYALCTISIRCCETKNEVATADTRRQIMPAAKTSISDIPRLRRRLSATAM